MEEKPQILKNKKLLILIPVLVLVIAVVGVTYAFFNYTRTGQVNNLSTGTIYFVTEESESSVSVTNFFPTASTGTNVDNSTSMTITVTGGTTYEGGIDYKVYAVNPTGQTNVPITIHTSAVNDTGKDIGYSASGTNGDVALNMTANSQTLLGTGHIAPEANGGKAGYRQSGVITVTAFLSSNLAITDTPVESSEWVGNRTTITTTDWNALAENPVTFNIRVVADEGVPPFRGTAAQLAASAASYGLETIDSTNNVKMYTGANPDNYVWFNGEQWRIIGVYNNQLKIVKATPLAETKVYNASQDDGNVWADSDLAAWLNDEETGYYSTLNPAAQGMIATGTWYAGAVATNANANNAYSSAQTTQVNNKKVGLIATYEYLYAAGSSCRTTAGSSYNSGSPTCASGDWLKLSSPVWTLSPFSDYAINALIVYSYGNVISNYVGNSYGVSPAVYLNSSVRITGGTGQEGSTNSYTLG